MDPAERLPRDLDESEYVALLADMHATCEHCDALICLDYHGAVTCGGVTEYVQADGLYFCSSECQRKAGE